MEVLVLRLFVWGLLPLGLIALALGPSRTWQRVRRLWAWIEAKRHEPTEVINRVVKDHEKNIRALREALTRAEAAQADILRNVRRSEDSIVALELEARSLAGADDDLGARAALYKVNLERLAVAGFRDQSRQQKIRIDQSRRRLHLLELQLRQYEVGRSILLSQLAEARTVEQQYALASQFDPFSAVAAWVRSEGVEQPAEPPAQTARSEHVCTNPADRPLLGSPLRIDPETLDAQLAELKAQTRRGTMPARAPHEPHDRS